MRNRSGALNATRLIVIVSVFLGLLLVVGFGISCEPQTPSSSDTTDVTIAGLAFEPAQISVPVGSTVTWVNQDSVVHNVTARDGSFSSGNLSRDETFSHTFEESGTFEYYCTIHPYMEGKVVVE